MEWNAVRAHSRGAHACQGARVVSLVRRENGKMSLPKPWLVQQQTQQKSLRFCSLSCSYRPATRAVRRSEMADDTVTPSPPPFTAGQLEWLQATFQARARVSNSVQGTSAESGTAHEAPTDTTVGEPKIATSPRLQRDRGAEESKQYLILLALASSEAEAQPIYKSPPARLRHKNLFGRTHTCRTGRRPLQAISAQAFALASRTAVRASTGSWHAAPAWASALPTISSPAQQPRGMYLRAGQYQY